MKNKPQKYRFNSWEIAEEAYRLSEQNCLKLQWLLSCMSKKTAKKIVQAGSYKVTAFGSPRNYTIFCLEILPTDSDISSEFEFFESKNGLINQLEDELLAPLPKKDQVAIMKVVDTFKAFDVQAWEKSLGGS